MFRKIFILLCLFNLGTSLAQQNLHTNSTAIYKSIEKLNFLGSVLYIAAHPDDENTQLISYFSNEVHARTGYLSLTRGDGGQNLIGSELRALLGVIRTQELLAARRIDGGEQFFTRANDFGYSKNPEETLNIWDENMVLSDVVRVIRTFRPDVIINRFNVESAGKTHGHHTSSAILSTKAFSLANDSSKFKDQLSSLTPWQPKRMFFNTSWWFYGSKEKFKSAMLKADYLTVDVGTYDPLLGLSNTEIAAKSRSQHKSQGFGIEGSRGSDFEYLELLKGNFPANGKTVFSGIDTSWNRLENGEAIEKILSEVQQNFNFKNPAASIPKLLDAYQLIQKLKDKHWRTIKLKAIKDIILAAAGVYVEVSSKSETAVAGEKIQLSLETINRSTTAIELKSIEFPDLDFNLNLQENLQNNVDFNREIRVQLPSDIPVSNPYWLNEPGSVGMYQVEDKQRIGLAETPPILNPVIEFLVNGIPIQIKRSVKYKTVDPVKGEVYSTFRVVPKVSVSVGHKMLLFNSDAPKEIQVKVQSFQDSLKGKLSLSIPENWSVYPSSVAIEIPSKNSKKIFTFTLTPPKNAEEAYAKPIFTTEGKSFSKELILIDYPHISKRQVLLPAKTKIVRLAIQKEGKKVAYIEGAGDAVAEGIEQMGFEVTQLEPAEITAESLRGFDAVVVGIRAYNVLGAIDAKQKILFNFVKNGGNMIVQYNKSFNLKTDQLAPFQLQLSRNRVTNEDSDVEFLVPEHPVLNVPNKITSKDFENWVQERGLYFPDKWGDEFVPILGMKDAGEPKQKGSLLVAKYGKGYYIYTGLSFFREFPAGVSGSYRLFANMLSLGK